MMIGPRKSLLPKGDLARMTGNLVSADDFSTGWAVSIATITANGATAPDGSYTADVLELTSSANTQHKVYYNFNITTSNIQYTARLRIKALNFGFCELLFGRDGGYSKFFGTTIDIQGCRVANSRGATYVGSPTIRRLPDNWRLIDIPFIPAFDATATHGFEINAFPSAHAIGTPWQPQATSALAVWGAELAPTAQ